MARTEAPYQIFHLQTGSFTNIHCTYTEPLLRYSDHPQDVTNIIEKMAKFIKSGKVAIVVRGRYAGKKVVIVKPQDEGTKAHPFPHAIVVGVERAPLKITKNLGAKKTALRSRVKPFVKVVNYNHLMPTRYTLDIESFKAAVTSEALEEVSSRQEAKKAVKVALEEKHQAGKNKWFFQKLQF